FEEEILHEYDKIVAEEAPKRYKDEYLDYLDYRIRNENLENYGKLISESKQALKIPVIASVNCSSKNEWTNFARAIQDAGADALEVNLFYLPTDFSKTAGQIEKDYLDIISRLKEKLTIPVALKISYYFTNLATTIRNLSSSGINGLVLFNRFYGPDIDIEKIEISSTNIFSHPDDQYTSLRWIAIMSGRVQCDLAASTGIHDGGAVIKQLLAGAKAVQVVSALYNKGPERIQNMLKDIKKWMVSHNFEKIDEFRGKLSQVQSPNPALYERVQFMKYFSDHDKNFENGL
ncbi:MAG: dihydroorotate dehydrogenase-like protein, partial [Bacteroidetes bacterium]|nr:dihydroorotate dehydrogenase-like protein [Bacteroidota bacterium]